MKKLLLFFMSFFTLLGFAQFPEGFENAAIALNTSPPATGWATFNNGIGTNNWIRSNTQTPRGTALARISQQQNVTNSINSLHWLVSPQVTIPVNGQVRFYSKQAQLADFNGEYTVRISTTSQTDPTTFTTVQTYDEATVSPMTGTPAAPAWEQKFVLLPTYVGQTVYIAFVKKNAGGDTWVIDDVKVDSQCLTPTALTATPLATSASLSWTSPNPAGPWVIEYGPAGFVPGTGTLVNATTNPFNLTGLTSLTGYTFYVRTLCDTDNPSPWSNSGNFSTSALPPNCGGNFVDTGGIAGNYSGNEDYIVTICPPNAGEYVTVTFSSFNTEANWDKLYVYDGNSTASPQIASANGPGNGTVLIPGAYWGTTIPGPFEATGTSGCLTFRFVSDGVLNNPGWTSNIVCQPYPTCRKPTNITSNAISPTSVTVSWTNNAPSASLWEVIAVPVGSPAPTAAMTGQTTTNPTTYTYTGLTSQTAYNFYVRAICATGTDVGPWSTTFSTSTTNPNYCAGDHFYDSGGATGNYGNNETRTWTICPTNTGDVVTVYFNSFNLISSVGDALTIYDGNSTAGTVVGTFYGTNIIPSYTASSPSGCLTFRFVSNATLNSAGWDATIVCGPPCPSITSVLNSTVPVAGSENTIRICQGATVQFNGSGTFAASGTGATYVWNFDDGTTATGQNVSHAFTNPGIYLVNLTITDPNGCRNSNRLDQKVYVSTTPIFTGTQAADDDICLAQSTTITGVVSPVPFTRVCAPPVSGTTFLPDGAGNSYISFVPVDCFPFGSTITAANQITSVCIDMEHSYLGDLEIRLVSPTGQSIILKAYPGGGGTYLGCPLDDPAIGPGTGRTYCFTPAATTLLVNGPTSPCGTPSSASINAGNYMPVQPFANLIGSQLNGNWSIIVTDNLGIDNGYIFNWSINFDNSILPTDYSFTPTIVNTFWSPSPSIVSTTGQTITVTPTAAGNHCYTYNAVDNFGCTYSQQVCIDVAPGVSLTSNTANPLSVYVGQNGTYYFSGGSPNAMVTYNVNGGASQQVILDASGNATVTIPSLAVNTTVTATLITQLIPTPANVIAATGGLNSANAIGPISPAASVANTTNCSTINTANSLVILRLANVLPVGSIITVSVARNTPTGSIRISDGIATLNFNSGNLNELQRIQFTMGNSTDIIMITHLSGDVYLDGIEYLVNIPGCDAPLNLPATVTVTPPPFPFITSITNDTNICLGANAIFTVLGSANTTVTYSINGGSTQTILLNGAGQGTITVNAPPASVNLLVSQIQLGTDISNIALTRTIIVNPLGQVNPITSQTVCQGTGTGAVVFSTSNTTGTTTYTWTNDNPAIGLAAASTGAATGIPSFVAQNATTAPISGLITVVPTYTSGGVSCIGTATTFTITVNPTPQITNKTAAICSGATFTVSPVNGTASDILAINTTYSWTFVDNTNVTGESNQSNQTAISQQLFNTTTAAQTVTYTVTPIGSNGCTGNTFTVTVTVNPEPVVANQTITTCSDVALNYSLDGLITGAGDTYTYTVASSNAASVPAGSPRAVASAANITDVYTNTTIAPVTITYTVTPTSANGCTGNTFTVTVTVNPEPVLTNQTITTCSDVALNYDLASLITGTGDLYTYTVASSNAASVPAGSPRAVASAANITDVYTNTTAAAVTITYTVTPIGSNGCTGNTFTVTVTVNPEPLVANQTVATCSDVALNYDLAALISGAGDTYTYTVASSNAISVPAGSPRAVASAANITDVYTNTTATAVTITYTVTPIGSNGCTGNTFTVTVTVNPEPVVANQTITTCSDVALNYSLDGLITGAGDTYTYTVASSNAASVPAGSPRAVASAANITDVYTNTTIAPVTITYTVTPTSATGCTGNTFTVTVTVNPEPVVTNQTITTCSDVALNYDLASLITGTGDLYTYTVASSNAASVPAGSPRAVASAVNITDVYTNTTAAAVTITYTVTPIGANGCTGNTFTVTVTVNPEPLVANQTVATCSDVALNYDLAALISGAGDTYTYTVASSNATSVPAGSPRAVASAANITDVYTNTTAAAVTITYTVTPIGSNGCTGNTFTVTVTVNPEPVVANQTITTCSDVALNYSLDALITGAGDTYTYTVASSNAASVPAGSPRAVASAANITDVYTNTTIAPVTITYTVTPTSATGCTGNTFTVTVTVNPEPVVTNQTITTCSDVALNYDLASLITGTGDLYTYTVASSNAASVPAGSPRAVASAVNITDVYTNTTAAAVTITYTVTPIGANGCTGNTFTVTVTVNPEPVVANQTITTCSNVALNYSLDALISGAGDTYTYTVASSNAISVPVGSPRAVASAANITDVYTNTTAAAVTITYTVTPIGSNGCTGNTFTVIVTVDPIATVVATPVSNFICTGSTTSIAITTPTTGTAPVTFNWTASILNAPTAGTITGFSSDNTGTLNIISQTLQNTGTSIGVVRYVVTPYIGLCPGTPVNVDITVNPLGQVDAIPNLVVCPGDVTTIVGFTSSNTGNTTYTWTNDTPSIGLAASGSTNSIPSFTAINTTASPIVATITVTPTFVDGSVSCLGTSTSFTITVNPTPTIILSSAVSSTNQIICVNTPITPIQYTFGANATGVIITGLPTGVTFAINGSIVTISGTPTTTSAATFNYAITTTGNSCGAPNLSGTIEVTNGILPLFNQVVPVCQGATINIPTTSTNGIIGVWNLVSTTANNVTYQFIPNPGQCALNTTMTIVVHPLPIVTPSVTTQSFCSGGTTNINLISNVPGATFSWTATATTITGQAGSVTGSGATSINQTLILNANQVAAGQVTYVIVAEANGCLGAPVTVVVTVNPIPNVVVSPTTQTICSGQTTSISFSGAINNTVFTWNVLSSVGVSGAFNGTGNAINQTLTTTGLSQGTVVYEVTPTLNGCVGMPQTITVTVNPVPELFGSATHPELCSGESTFISVSTFSSTTVFNWVVEPFGVSGASAGTATGSSILIEQALSTTGNAQGYVDYIITPVLTACAGTPITVRVYVNPLPVVSLTDGTICVDAAGVPFQTYLLDSGLDNANYDFVWTFEGNTIPNATQATYSAGEVGTYTVVATNSTTNCVSNIARAVVTATNPATAITVTQSDYFSNNATLTVTVTGGNGTLLYQLDEGILQESNVFTGVTGGSHIITVVDTQGCTYLTQEVLIIDYPRYFTPNGDGHNDTWNITGLNQPDAKLFIFDRYGKLIKQIAPSSSSSGWDGTYNNEFLPSTDYWFTLDYTENGAAKQFKAHFSLKR